MEGEGRGLGEDVGDAIEDGLISRVERFER